MVWTDRHGIAGIGQLGMFQELLRLAISNLGRARARLLMTVGGVVVGTTAVILLIALTFGLQNAAEAGIGESTTLTQIDVYTTGRGSSGDAPALTEQAIIDFWQIPGVRLVLPTVRLQSSQMSYEDYFGFGEIMGIDPRLLPYMSLPVARGEPSLANGQVIAGSTVHENFYNPESEEFTPISIDLMQDGPITLMLTNFSAGSTREVDLTFSAELAQTNSFTDYVIYMDINQVREWNEWITGEEYDPETFTYDQVTVFAADRESVSDISEAIKDMGFGAGGIGDYLNSLNDFFVTMRLMLGAVGGVALLVAAFGVANTMMMAIMERTREIGIMKAIGATNEAILTLFLLEAGLVGLVGGIMGVLLAQGVSYLVNTGIQNMPQGDGGYYFLPIDPNQIGGQLLVVPSELTVFAIGLATIVGIFAGLYPAWRAANLPPVIALKHD